MRKIGLLVWSAVCTALIVCGAYISIPLAFSPVPIVLQNLFVLLCGLLLGAWWGGVSVLVYLLLGVIGLPVFAGGAGGVAHLLGPTGGYLIGFLFSAVLVGAVSSLPRLRRRPHSLLFDIAAVAIGVVVVYLWGVPWLMRTAQVSFVAALAVGVVPFLIGDVIKATLAIIIARFVRARLLLPV